MTQRTPSRISGLLAFFVFATPLLATLLATPLLADNAVRLLELPEQQGRVRLMLDSDISTAWDQADISRLVLRSADRQRSLSASSPNAQLDVQIDAGCSMLLIDLGDRVTKIATCRPAASPRLDLEARFASGDQMTAKTGGRVEIRPLRSPAVLAPGSDLPVLVYFEGIAQAGARVVGNGPDGQRQQTTTDAVGAAHFHLPKSGPWVVRYRHGAADQQAVAELRFEVASKDLWRVLPSALPSAATSNPTTKDLTKMDGPEWRELGPAPSGIGNTVFDTGRASAIVAVAGRPNRYYVGGASGGVWESVNGGQSWTSLNDSLPILTIGALAVDPKNDRVIYAGSGEANNSYHSLYGLGLYRTFNRGKTWTVLAPRLFEGRTFSRLAVSPSDNRLIWAAVGPAGGSYQAFEGARNHPKARGQTGLFRSNDRGVTWKHLRAGNGLANFAALDFDLDPVDPNRVYVSMADTWGRTLNGVYRSIDGGENFEPVLTSQSTGRVFGRLAVAIAPSDPDRLYTLVANPGDREAHGGFFPGGTSFLGLYRSDDGGTTWALTTTPPSFMGEQGSYDLTLIVHPTDPDTFFLGGVQMLRSTDGGQSFTNVTPVHVDLHDLAFDAAGRLLVANDGGVNRSSDLGNTWVPLNRGLGLYQIYPGLSVHPTRRNQILAGMQDNGTNLRFDDSTGWRRVLGGDGGYTAFDPNNGNIAFAEFQGSGNLY